MSYYDYNDEPITVKDIAGCIGCVLGVAILITLLVFLGDYLRDYSLILVKG